MSPQNNIVHTGHKHRKTMTHLHRLQAVGLGLVLSTTFAAAQQNTAEQEIDMTRKEYADRYIGIEELKDAKYHLWPIVEDGPGVVNFFKAICNSYYIDLWYCAEAWVSNPSGEGMTEKKPKILTIDPEQGYICVDFDGDGKLLVECCEWIKENSTHLVAFNFNYDQNADDQYFTRYHAHDLLFYEFEEGSSELHPVLPPIVGIKNFKGIRLPHEGKDLTLANGKKLYWHDGSFSTKAPARQ